MALTFSTRQRIDQTRQLCLGLRLTNLLPRDEINSRMMLDFNDLLANLRGLNNRVQLLLATADQMLY